MFDRYFTLKKFVSVYFLFELLSKSFGKNRN